MDSLVVVENAVIVPSQKGAGRLGVLDAEGRFVPQSTIWRSDAPLYPEPEPVVPKTEIAGTHLFGGILSMHFGHFVVESLSRLWPIDAPPEQFESILFVPKGPTGRERKESGFQTTLLDMVAPGLPRQLLSEPVRVERLIVPEQGFGNGALESGTPEFRRFLQSRVWPEPKATSPRKIYITRAGLDRNRKGRILGDQALCAYLEARGYAVLAPERTPLEDQIRLYRGADRLIFDDGSAVHVYGLVARPRQVAASIQRRFAGNGPAVGVRQLRTMADVDLKAVDAVVREWRPATLDRATSKSHGELDARHLFEALRGLGVTADGDGPDTLNLPDAAAVAADMGAAGYVPVERAAPLPEPPSLMRFWGVDVPVAAHLDQRKLRSMRDGFYERQEVLNAFAHFRPEDRLLELGAGSGVVGGAVALTCGLEALLSFEANPDLIPMATALYARNGLQDRAEVRHAIVLAGEEGPKEMTFGVAKDFLGSKIVAEGEAAEPGMRLERVPTVRFSEVAAAFRPTALMMDIEGGELPFLEQADLSPFRVIVLELHRHVYGREGMKRCRAALTAAGFRADPDYCRRSVEAWVRV